MHVQGQRISQTRKLQEADGNKRVEQPAISCLAQYLTLKVGHVFLRNVEKLILNWVALHLGG